MLGSFENAFLPNTLIVNSSSSFSSSRPTCSSRLLASLRLHCALFLLSPHCNQSLSKVGRDVTKRWSSVPSLRNLIKHTNYKCKYYNFCAKECFCLSIGLQSSWQQLIACSKNSSNMDHIHNLRSARMPRMQQAGYRKGTGEEYKYYRTRWSNSIPFSTPKEELFAITQGRIEKYKNFQICGRHRC